MPATTQDLDKILKLSENLYEAVMIVAKRARQINEEQYQHKRDQQIMEELHTGLDEDLIHSELEEAEAEVDQEMEKNPLVIALEEFLEGKLEYHYEPTRG